jgi:hypothetical protein
MRTIYNIIGSNAIRGILDGENFKIRNHLMIISTRLSAINAKKYVAVSPASE